MTNCAIQWCNITSGDTHCRHSIPFVKYFSYAILIEDWERSIAGLNDQLVEIGSNFDSIYTKILFSN